MDDTADGKSFNCGAADVWIYHRDTNERITTLSWTRVEGSKAIKGRKGDPSKFVLQVVLAYTVNCVSLTKVLK